MIRSLEELTPPTAAAARTWLADAVAMVPASAREVVADELLASVCEVAAADMTPPELVAAVRAIEPIVVAEEAAPRRDPLVGRWCGIPYDVRPPTGERIRQSMWNPADPRLLTPRAFGAGWDLNVGAMAVKLGLLEPDAEDVPFARTPEAAFAWAAGLPVALSAAVLAHYAIRGPGLPASLSRHWDASGVPDGWTSKRAAAMTDVVASVAGSALAASAARSSRSGAERAGRLAAAGALAGGAATLTVARSVPRGGWWVGPLLLAALVGGAAVPLLGLALAGRRGEQRRDLGGRA